uniref:G-protein coupled receptors family 1 profile domain-containing protein n=1 Tax=Acrobeloides nanus TaxID=290746 RepID=A0A914DS27_9BILA
MLETESQSLNNKYNITHEHTKEIRPTKDDEDDAGSPIVLVMVVILFLICNAVSLLVNIFDMIEGLLSKNAQMALIDVGNILVVFNATANFFIYVGFSSSYRKKLKEILCLDNSKSTANL